DGLQPAGERGDPLGAQTAAAGRLRLALGLRTLRLGLGTLLLRLAGRYGRRRLGRGTRVEQARPTDLAGTGVLGGVLRRGTVAAGRGGTLAGHLELATSCLQRAARLLQFGALPRYRLLQGDDVVIDLAPLVSTQHDVEPGLSRIATRRLPVGAGTVVSGHRSHLLEVELAEAPGARPVWAHPRGSDRTTGSRPRGTRPSLYGVGGAGRIGARAAPQTTSIGLVDTLRRTLRERAMRMTPQRQLVLDAVRELGHATPEQICATVQRSAPAVNITTVYRTLDLLERLELV